MFYHLIELCTEKSVNFIWNVSLRLQHLLLFLFGLFEIMTIALKKYCSSFDFGLFNVAILTLNSRKAPIAAPSVKRNSALESRLKMFFHRKRWKTFLEENFYVLYSPLHFLCSLFQTKFKLRFRKYSSIMISLKTI